MSPTSPSPFHLGLKTDPFYLGLKTDQAVDSQFAAEVVG